MLGCKEVLNAVEAQGEGVILFICMVCNYLTCLLISFRGHLSINYIPLSVFAKDHPLFMRGHGNYLSVQIRFWMIAICFLYFILDGT